MTLSRYRGSKDLLSDPKDLDSEKVLDNSKDLGGEKLFQDPNELGREKMLNKIKSKDKVRPRGEHFRHSRQPHYLQGQRYFDGTHHPRVLNEQSGENVTGKLSVEDKVELLQETFKSIPPLMIKQVLQRDDVKGDLQTASSCLKAISLPEGTSSIGERKRIRTLENKNKDLDVENLFHNPKDLDGEDIHDPKAFGKTEMKSKNKLSNYLRSLQSKKKLISVQYKKANSQVLITFKDPDEMQKVLSTRSYTLNDAKLTAERANPAFQNPIQAQPAGDEIAIVFDQDIIEFISKTNCVTELLESLSAYGFDMTFFSPENSIVKITPKIGEESSANKEKAIKSVTDFTKTFKAMELDVHKNHWDAVMSEISKLHNEIGKNKLLIKESFIEEKVTIICRVSDSRDLKKRFLDKIEETRSLETKKSFAKETIDIGKERIRLLNMTGYKDKLLMEYVDLKIDFDQANGKVTIVGPKRQLDDAKISIYQQLSKFWERKISLSQSLFEMLNTDEGLARIHRELEIQQINAVLYIDEEDADSSKNVFVVGIDKNHASEAYDVMERLTTEIKVEVEKGNEDILQTQKWSNLCDEVRRQFKVCVRRNEHFETWIAGFMVDVWKAHKQIQRFLNDNSIVTESYCCLEKGVRRFVLEYQKNDLDKMETNLKHCFAKIKAGKTAEQFLISGTRLGVSRAQKGLDTLTDLVAVNEIKVQQPGLHKLFTTGRGTLLLKSVEHEYQCAIEKVDESMVPIPSIERDDECDTTTAQAPSFVSKSADSKSITCGKVRISWKQGTIAAEEADVLVASTNGQLCRVFQAAGGPQLQRTIKQTQIRTGEVKVIHNGNLHCKNVILTSCCRWDGGKGTAKNELGSIVQQCLLKASQLGATSIAFPIIVTSGLGFPYNTACQIMIKEVNEVINSGWQTSSLNDIRFVVFNEDAQLVNAFQEEFTRAKGLFSAHAYKYGRHSSRLSDSSSATTTNTIGKVTVQVIRGSLVQEQTDAIVNINSTAMNMQNAGALSKAVAAAAGSAVQAECTKIGKQAPGSAVVTGAGKLKAKNIIHMIPGKPDRQHIQSCIEECLRVADSNMFQSISMPAFGTGSYCMSGADSAQVTFQALANMFPKLKHVREVRIVIFHADLLTAFKRRQWLYEIGRSSEMKLSKGREIAKSTKGDSDLVETIEFRLFGKSKDHVNRARSALIKVLKETRKTQTIKSKDVPKLSEQQRQNLKTRARQLGVTITFQNRENCIVVQGDSEDVAVIVNFVWEEIHRKSEEELVEKQYQNAEVIYDIVKWRFQEDGKNAGFDVKVNAEIEKARVNKEEQITVEIKGKKCVIDFATATGTELISGRTFPITRATTKGSIEEDVALPKEWVPMPKDSHGKEKTVHLVPLGKGSDEYQDVLNMFQLRGGKGQIIRMERIQNPHLYKQYMVRKQKMDNDNKGMNNERKLFHGTEGRNLKNINSTGFNRSFCGKHGKFYGDGVYFATDASYSYSYTQPDANNNRHMYVTRVLVGRYTRGKQGMKVPPNDDNRPGISFDSVANYYYRDVKSANIFVVFYDSQCYPEYLITFQ